MEKTRPKPGSQSNAKGLSWRNVEKDFPNTCTQPANDGIVCLLLDSREHGTIALVSKEQMSDR